MIPRTLRLIPSLFVAAFCVGLPAPSFAIAPASLAGVLEGTVTDLAGHPQMGATVLLFNRQEKLLQRAFTNENGNFVFTSLTPDFYALRVTLSTFLPAFRDRILIQSGVRRFLDINLSGLFSSIQIVNPAPGTMMGLMSDDWKWVLRTSSATRPILRLLPTRIDDPSQTRHAAAMFSDTRGLVRVSAGDGGRASSYGDEADLGTAFAFATSFYGSNQLQVSGNVGYAAASGLPSAGFRTTYSRNIGDMISPEVSVTMRQLFVPNRSGSAMDNALPPLRTMSVSFGDKTQISDALNLTYGFELDSVSFVERLHYFSPYARLTYDAGSGRVDFSYTSGNARPDLGMNTASEGAELQSDINSLALVPRVSLRGARAKVQRGENYELGYTGTWGSREFRVSGYRESVTNAALTIVSPDGDSFTGDLLPDLFSNSSVFNAGDYHTLGYTASIAQNLGDNYKLTMMYGSAGVLAPESGAVAGDSPEDLRAMIHASRRHAITTRASGTVPLTGTRFIASYQFTNYRAATPAHIYSTQPARPEPGFNIYVRQPLPPVFNLPWRMEATADMRNLLAQGYLPLSTSDGRRLLLVHTPRSFRGGVTFTF